MQPNPTAIVVTEDSLDTIADRINDAVFNAESAARSAMQFAIEAGELLNQAKQKVAHGEWLGWLGSNIELAPRTCQAYMRLAAKVRLLPTEEAQRVTDLPVREAIHAITTTPTGPHTSNSKRVYIPSLTAREAIEKNLRVAASGLRSFSKKVHAFRRKDIDRVRQILTQALESLSVMEVDDA
jgi:hypothetical protein